MALLEVVLLAGPAFAVSARRMQRSLALMAATGATPPQARRVVLAERARARCRSGPCVGVGLGLLVAWPGLPLVQRSPTPASARSTCRGCTCSPSPASACSPRCSPRSCRPGSPRGRTWSRCSPGGAATARPSLRSPLLGVLLLGGGVALAAYGARRRRGQRGVLDRGLGDRRGAGHDPAGARVVVAGWRGWPGGCRCRCATPSATPPGTAPAPCPPSPRSRPPSPASWRSASPTPATPPRTEATYSPTLAAGARLARPSGGPADTDWDRASRSARARARARRHGDPGARAPQRRRRRSTEVRFRGRRPAATATCSRRAVRLGAVGAGRRRRRRPAGVPRPGSPTTSARGRRPCCATVAPWSSPTRAGRPTRSRSWRREYGQAARRHGPGHGRRSLLVAVPTSPARARRAVLSPAAAAAAGVTPRWRRSGCWSRGVDDHRGAGAGRRPRRWPRSRPTPRFYVERGYQADDATVILLLILGALGGVLMLGGTLTATFLVALRRPARPGHAVRRGRLAAHPARRRGVVRAGGGLVGAVLGAPSASSRASRSAYPLTDGRPTSQEDRPDACPATSSASRGC